MEMRLNKTILFVISLLLISCKQDAQKTKEHEKVEIRNKNGINFFDKKYNNISYSLIIDESNISDHPQKSYLDCKEEGYFTIHYIPKTESLRHFWKELFFENYDFNNVDLEKDNKKIEMIFKNKMNEYNIFSYKINKEFLDAKGSCTLESVFAKENTTAYVYYFNPTDKTWKLLKNIASETLPPYLDSDFFLTNFPQYFNSEAENTISVQTNSSKLNAKQSNKWYGNYHVNIDYAKLDENSEMSVEYDIEIKDGICTLSGMGYKTYFTDVCEIEEENNKLVLKYVKSTDGDGFSDHSTIDVLGELINKNGVYYLKSPIVADSKWNYNTEIKLTKSK